MKLQEPNEGAGKQGGSPAKHIEDAHQVLRSRFDAIAGAPSRSALLDLLLPMSQTLREHFEVEERVGGLYDHLHARRPSLEGRLRELREEHRSILEELDLLHRQLEAREDRERGAMEIEEPLANGVARWLERLRMHERSETSMISDVYYVDEGGYG